LRRLPEDPQEIPPRKDSACRIRCRSIFAWLALIFCAGLLLAGETASRLPPVRLDGHYFTRNGKRFIPVGAHWVPARAGLHWPLAWDAGEIEADFRQMKALGFNTVRLDLFWAWFEPRPGDYNPEAFRQLDFLITLAHRYSLYLHPSLFIGGEVGEAWWDVSWRHGRNPQSDPEMLRLETNHAAELARRYKGEPAILAWDLTDEPPFWIAPAASDAVAINWTRLIAGALHRYDPGRPLVVGTSMEDVGHGPFRPDNIREEVDFFSVHPYTVYAQQLFPDPMLSVRPSWGAAFEALLSRGAGRPVMVQELGSSSAQYGLERAAAYDRVSLYSALGAGANGFLLWCYTDTALENYHVVPYLRSPHETQFGLTTWDRQERPRAREFRRFASIVGALDLDAVEPAPAEAAIVVPEEWSRPTGDFTHAGLEGPEILPYVSTTEGSPVAGVPLGAGADNAWITGSWLSAFILAQRAGLNPDFPREYEDWDQRPFVLLPAPLTATSASRVHVHTDFWLKALHYVEAGGSLYASVCGDAAIPGMERLFGARLEDHLPVADVTVRVVAPFGTLRPGDTFHFSANAGDPRHWAALLTVAGGTVVAVDGEGHPALVSHTVGKGRTLLSAYPLETYLSSVPSVFDKPEETYRIYRAFREWSGTAAHFEADNSAVQVSELRGGKRGYLVLVNHSAQPVSTRVKCSFPLSALRRIEPGQFVPIPIEQNTWRVDLEAYGGAVLEWTRPAAP
jgi:endo-1,4-beta-mannosidase